jgi:uncharacterized damage-inducible protein DinB
MTEEDLRYPLGRFQAEPGPSDTGREALIEAIHTLPTELRAALEDLPAGALDHPYRPGGWTVRQLVHHLADSHLNAYVRFRLALTEDHPTIRPYDQDGWAALADAARDGVAPSLAILDGVHARWASLLATLPREAFSRTLYHPESGEMSLDTLLQLYVWHGRHHLAHIRRTGAGE